MLDAARRRQVRADDAAPARRRRGERIGILIGDDHRRAFVGEQIGDSPADAVCAGTDKRELVAKLVIHE